jgi:hypothetical protein
MNQATRRFAAARAAYGLALLCWPGQAARLAQGAPADGRIQVVARVLGVRHLTQAAATAARPSPEVLTLSAGTDLAHAASMLVLAVTDRLRCRAALVDAAVAAAFATAGAALARNHGDPDDQPR